jgi:hypothetical protein
MLEKKYRFYFMLHCPDKATIMRLAVISHQTVCDQSPMLPDA